MARPSVLIGLVLLVPSLALADPGGSGLTPLTELTGSAKYKGQDGGLYGRDGNAPPAQHQKLIQEQSKKITPLDRDGKPSPLGRIVVLGLGGGPAADAFIRFKSRADRDPDTVREIVLVDGTQSDQDSSAWADPKNSSPWTAVSRRLDGAGVTAKQVQAIWLCECLAAPGKVGDYPKHTAKLQEELETIVTGLPERFPNLRVVYLSSAAYAGYASDKQAGEPFAFESGLAVRGLIQEQINGAERLSKAPVLAWGPYLWADGAKSRDKDGLVWKREDFLPDGLRFSATGRDKAGDALLRFFQEDAVASSWFCKLPR